MRGVGERVLFKPTVGVEPNVGSEVGAFVGADGRLLLVGEALVVGLELGSKLIVGNSLTVGDCVGLEVGFAST